MVVARWAVRRLLDGGVLARRRVQTTHCLFLGGGRNMAGGNARETRVEIGGLVGVLVGVIAIALIGPALIVFAFVLGGDSEAAPWIFVIGLVVMFITLCVAVVYGVMALFMGSAWLMSRGLFWLFVGGGMAGMAAWKAGKWVNQNLPSILSTLNFGDVVSFDVGFAVYEEVTVVSVSRIRADDDTYPATAVRVDEHGEQRSVPLTQIRRARLVHLSVTR
jgi:hypothetical protein